MHVKKSYQKKIALNLFCRPSTGSHHGCASHRHPCLSGFETHTVHTYIVLGYFEMKKSQKFQENVKKGSFERGKGQSGREIFVPYPMVHSRGAKSAICVTQNIWHMSAFCQSVTRFWLFSRKTSLLLAFLANLMSKHYFSVGNEATLKICWAAELLKGAHLETQNDIKNSQKDP